MGPRSANSGHPSLDYNSPLSRPSRAVHAYFSADVAGLGVDLSSVSIFRLSNGAPVDSAKGGAVS